MILGALFFSSALALILAKPFDRERREPGRAMTWSGWMPGAGMSVFASSEDPWGQQFDNHGLRPPSSMSSGWGFDEARSTEESLKPKPFDEVEEKEKKPFDDERDRKPGKPLYHKPRKGNDDDYDDRRYPGSNANASFNAWFPIMLGMYPGSEGRSKNGSNYRGEDSGSVAAIANSVNHGRSGVASSHAVVYSGQPPSNNQNYKTFKKY